MNVRDFKTTAKEEKGFGGFVSNFIKELSNAIEKGNNGAKINKFKGEIEEIGKMHEKQNSLNEIKEGKIYVVTGIQGKILEVLDIENGHNFDITIATETNNRQKLSQTDMFVYNMNEYMFKRLEQGNKLLFSNRRI